jgi:hypothetical protein
VDRDTQVIRRLFNCPELLAHVVSFPESDVRERRHITRHTKVVEKLRVNSRTDVTIGPLLSSHSRLGHQRQDLAFPEQLVERAGQHQLGVRDAHAIVFPSTWR